MDPDSRNDPDEGPVESGWTLTRTVRLCVAFAAPLVLLVFAGSLLVIPLIYLAVFVEGVFVALVAIPEVRSANRRSLAGYGGDGPTKDRAGRGGDRVQTLASYVKWAAKGSDFSRRDVARTVVRIAGWSSAAQRGGEGSLSDPELAAAFRTVVSPYRDDPFVRAGMRTLSAGPDRGDAPEADAGRDRKPPGRARYLASLEQVVSKLGEGMDRSGSS